MQEQTYLFEGLKVLEVSTWIAAPTASTMLADLGAEVIKIELPEEGDAYRNWALLPVTPTAEVNYAWALDARNKRSLSLNLKSHEGMAILHRLIRDCDVYISNQPLPLRRELKLTYEDIRDLNSRMIYASLTPYGEEGPERDKEAFDLVAYWSRSGLMNKMRHPDLEPIQALGGLGDHPTGVALYASIVTALLRRERTGEGGFAYTSLLANGLWSASSVAQAAFAAADYSSMPPQRITTALYQAKDGRWLQFSMVRTQEQFDQLLICFDRLDLLTDERYATPESRIEHWQEITAMMRAVIAEKTSEEWMISMTELGIPVARVAEFEDLPEDPQVLINNMAVEPVDDVGMSRVIRDPVNVRGIDRVGVKKAPDLGEHSDEILAELGYSRLEIDDFRDRGVI